MPIQRMVRRQVGMIEVARRIGDHADLTHHALRGEVGVGSEGEDFVSIEVRERPVEGRPGGLARVTLPPRLRDPSKKSF